jgi:hypothetical protein
MFRLEISTDSAAFDDGFDGQHEIVRILRDLAAALEHGAYDSDTTKPLLEVNGNRAGSWTWTSRSEEAREADAARRVRVFS